MVHMIYDIGLVVLRILSRLARREFLSTEVRAER